MSSALPWTLPYIRWRQPNHVYPGMAPEVRQCHDHLFLLTTAGKGHVTINGSRLTAVPERLFYILPSWWYSYQADEGVPLEFLTLHFDWVARPDSEGLIGFDNPTGLPAQQNFSVPGWDVGRTPYLDLQGDTTLLRAFRALNAGPKDPGGPPALQVQSAGWVLVILGHLMQLAQDQLSGTSSGSSQFQNALQLLRDRNGTLEPAAIASRVGWSLSHLRRMCRAHLNQTPGQIQRAARLKHAESLLEKGVPVSEVASRCGFADPAYFARLYKRHTGLSPRRHVGNRRHVPSTTDPDP